MIKFLKSFFGAHKPTEPAKVETPAVEAQKPVEEVQTPAEANPVAVAVALDLETADMGAPAKKPRAPRAPKVKVAAAPKAAPKAKAEKAPAKKAAAKKPAAVKAPKKATLKKV